MIQLQNRIVDERFRDSDYRTSQNYVGETVAWHKEIHFACPKPENPPALMEGLMRLTSYGRGTRVVIHAAAVAYGFVFLHPFENGNGRIHRFLIDHILLGADSCRRNFPRPPQPC